VDREPVGDLPPGDLGGLQEDADLVTEGEVEMELFDLL
jgi:hypothetical protein